MQFALKNYAILGTVLMLVGGVVQASRTWQAHLDEDKWRDERIRELQRIAVQEHPQYTATINWEGGR